MLSLRALSGDPVSEQYLKADLHRRAEALSDLPDTPLFFGRLDYAAGEYAGDRFHVGRLHVHDPAGTPVVIDWRAPVSRPFYRASRTEPMGLELRRRFGFAGGELTAFEDERFAAGPIPGTGPDAAGDAGVDSGGGGDSGLLGPDGGPLVLELIDNMENLSGVIALSNGRDGFWHVYDDNSVGMERFARRKRNANSSRRDLPWADRTRGHQSVAGKSLRESACFSK